ncbi:MAG: FHA domain-containing protein [Sedimentisphaerales bacterium]|nr:FHA domain-containing protein [Sedimentisphaerales bacterium]
MRLLLRQKDGAARELLFEKGPVSIGRGADSSVFLPDPSVSRQHAMLHRADDGTWLVEDLDSASKTYLNDQPVRKARVKPGDVLRITEFSIELAEEQQSPQEQQQQPQEQQPPAQQQGPQEDEEMQMADTMHLQAALATPPHETVVRNPDAGHAPAMRLAAKRLVDFSKATEKICSAESIDQLLLTLLDLILEEFDAFHVWCALRIQPGGPMTCHAGKKVDGSPIDLNAIPLREKIIQAVEKGQFLVMPRVSAQLEEEDAIRSAMIAAIMRPDGCFGVLYVDNAMKEKHFSLSDLDYLMLVAMHTAAVMKKFL